MAKTVLKAWEYMFIYQISLYPKWFAAGGCSSPGTPPYNWNIVESGVKHNNPNSNYSTIPLFGDDYCWIYSICKSDPHDAQKRFWTAQKGTSISA